MHRQCEYGAFLSRFTDVLGRLYLQVMKVTLPKYERRYATEGVGAHAEVENLRAETPIGLGYFSEFM